MTSFRQGVPKMSFRSEDLISTWGVFVAYLFPWKLSTELSRGHQVHSGAEPAWEFYHSGAEPAVLRHWRRTGMGLLSQFGSQNTPRYLLCIYPQKTASYFYMLTSTMWPQA